MTVDCGRTNLERILTRQQHADCTARCLREYDAILSVFIYHLPFAFFSVAGNAEDTFAFASGIHPQGICGGSSASCHEPSYACRDQGRESARNLLDECVGKRHRRCELSRTGPRSGQTQGEAAVSATASRLISAVARTELRRGDDRLILTLATNRSPLHLKIGPAQLNPIATTALALYPVIYRDDRICNDRRRNSGAGLHLVQAQVPTTPWRIAFLSNR